MKKRNFISILLLLIISIIFIFNCIESSSDDDGKKKKKKGTNISTINTTTTDTNTVDTTTNTVTNENPGTIAGSYSGDAEIILDQSDGTQQTTTTSTTDPDFVFTDVPAGEAIITINPDDGSTSQTQTVQVDPGSITLINPFGSTTPIDNSLSVNIYDMGIEQVVDDDGKDNDGDGQIDEEGESIIVFNDLNGDGKTTSDDFSANTMADTKTFYSKEINVPIRRFSDGFPGITDRIEWFGVKVDKKIKAPKTGAYTFIIVCDDGAKLSIGGNKMTMIRIGKGDNYFKGAYSYVQNPSTVPGFPECDGSTWLVTGFENVKTNTICDSVHAPAIYKCTVNLTAGQEYDFELKYYQGPKMHIACIMEVDIPDSDNDSTGTDGIGAVLFNTELFK